MCRCQVSLPEIGCEGWGLVSSARPAGSVCFSVASSMSRNKSTSAGDPFQFRITSPTQNMMRPILSRVPWLISLSEGSRGNVEKSIPDAITTTKVNTTAIFSFLCVRQDSHCFLSWATIACSCLVSFMVHLPNVSGVGLCFSDVPHHHVVSRSHSVRDIPQ